MSEFPSPEESPFEHPNGNTYVWNGWAWEIEGESNDYATEEYVDGADVVVGEEANTYTDYHVSQAHKSAIEQANSYTDEQVAGIEIPEVPPLPDDLVTQDDLEGLATEEYVDTAIDGIEIPPLPDDLVHQPDLVGLASEAYVDSAIDAIPEVEIPEIPEIPSIEGLATVEYSDEMDAEVLDTAKRYADSVVKIEAGDNEVAQTYLQNPDIGAGGYQMTYWYSGAESAGGEIDASNIKNKNGGFAWVRAKANEFWGWLCIHEDYLGKSVDLDLHGLKSFWFKDWGSSHFYISKYGQNVPKPPEGAAWHSSGVSVSAGSLGASVVNAPFDGPDSLDNICNGGGREFHDFADGDKAAVYGWLSLQEPAKEFKRGFIRSDENGHARMVEDPESSMFMCYVKCNSALSQAKIHSVTNRHPGPISIYKENPLESNEDAPGDDPGAGEEINPDDYLKKAGGTLTGGLTLDLGADVTKNKNSFRLMGTVRNGQGDLYYGTLFKDYRRKGEHEKSDYIEYFGGVHSDSCLITKGYVVDNFVPKAAYEAQEKLVERLEERIDALEKKLKKKSK